MQKKDDRGNFIWNMIDGMVMAAFSFLATVVVVRLTDPATGGVYSIANAVGQIMSSVGEFGMRGYQVTDLRQRYATFDYLASRAMTCLGMLALSLCYAAARYGLTWKAGVILCFCLMRVFSAYADVLHASLQAKGRLDVAGRLSTARTVVTNLACFVVLGLTSDLLLAAAASAISAGVMMAALDFPLFFRHCSVRPRLSWGRVRGILLACTPLFLGCFLNMYLANASKYSIDRHLESESQTYFNIIFMPANIINLFTMFVVRPMLSRIAEMAGEEGALRLRRFLLVTAGGIFLVMGGGAVLLSGLGLRLLSLLYGVDVSGCLPAFRLVLLGGCFLAMASVLFYVLVARRRQRGILCGYALASVAAALLNRGLVPHYGILGACAAFCVSQVVLVSCFMAAMWKGTRGRA